MFDVWKKLPPIFSQMIVKNGDDSIMVQSVKKITKTHKSQVCEKNVWGLTELVEKIVV